MYSTKLTKMITLNIHFPLSCQMKFNGVNTMFPFQNDTLVNKVQDMTQKIPKNNLLEDLNNVCR